MPTDYTILVVDDSAQYRTIISKYLKNMGLIKIETAEDGNVGIEKANSIKPHIIYLDGIMPGMDGITALRIIKKECPDSIVIISSSLSEQSKVKQFKDEGASYYLLKPYEREKFEEVTKKALALLEQRQRSTS